MQNARSVIIIGAGIGGIAAAAHLAQRGYQVTVLEKNRTPGGRCDRLIRAGHLFNTGPTLLIMPHVFAAEFAALGSDLHEVLDLERIDPTYRLVFDDGEHLSLTSDLVGMRTQLEAIEPGSFAGYLRYLAEGRQHYDIAMQRLVNHDFRTASDFFSLANVPLLYQLKPLIPHYQHMAKFFTSPRLKAAFTFQDVYMGLSPFDAPSTFSMMPYTELADGVWYPKGGMYDIVEALMRIARAAGATFEFHAPVAHIDIQNAAARGVTLADGRQYHADIVVANADLPYVYQHLLPDADIAATYDHKEYSCSTVSFFWGVDRVYPELGAHTLFLAEDYAANFHSITDELTIPTNPSLYVHAPVRLEASAAPPGKDTLIAVVPIGHIDPSSPRDWVSIRQRARSAVFARLKLLGIADLADHITAEVSFMPKSWQKRYNLTLGATHGLAHTLTQLGYMRPHNRHAHYHNLYFVGASTHPGTGVPTALVSARLVAQRISDEV